MRRLWDPRQIGKEPALSSNARVNLVPTEAAVKCPFRHEVMHPLAVVKQASPDQFSKQTLEPRHLLFLGPSIRREICQEELQESLQGVLMDVCILLSIEVRIK